MNTVILTIILFFNGTTHVITQPFSMYAAASSNLRACWRIGGEVQAGVDDAGIRVLSVQCTLKNLKE